MSKVIVVGGGIVGLSIALELQKRRGDVILLDPDSPRKGASYGNAGHIAIEQVEPLASWSLIRSAWRRWFARGGALSFPPSGISAWLPFGFQLMAAAEPTRFAHGKVALSGLMGEAMPAWRRLVQSLGAPDLIREDGHYVVWESEGSAKAGLEAWSDTDTGTARFHVLTPDERAAVSALTPRPLHGGIRFENTGQVADNVRLLAQMEACYLAAGGQAVRQSAAGLSVRDGHAQVESDDGLMRAAEAVIVCAGARSKPLMQGIGHAVPLIAERGYHIQSAQHGWSAGLPPVVFEDRSMIVTGFEGGLRAASFVELNQPDAPADARKWQRLRQHVSELGLPMGGEVAQWMGIRPTLPDYLPAIGRSDKAQNLYYAFGHQHLGLTLGPVTGEIVADMVETGVGPQAFDIKRFG
ncbi:NAD(P)/FAD-dependent oxidoreductase [Asticcacaulis excentricus]|uniref:FAD dependent oxidoreductase n=1 Tax=Asticcacaulis excentricus (strain ATCC 15261 / DSM 4724 / KCTC 12464 / NCIMB 9791 / VKM B-1370 / CB 48) TaxID=573065 RepID=E8RU60_ASTEC|nr:FAD-dependent oxidoreductase [Asticcacaulis excentricus]ADU15031.1 FAD dependent oxidoreductase [Asticcacaulis excentricus CB 48]